MFKNIVKKTDYKETTKIGRRYRVQWDRQAIMIPEYDSGGTKTGEHEDPIFVTCMEETFDYKPELGVLKELINGYYNNTINNEIVLGFSYEVESGVTLHPYLSNENQINYKNAYDMIMNNITAQYFLPYTIKNSNGYEPAYYSFTTAESFRDFYVAMLAYIQDELAKAWNIKDNIDWSKYVFTPSDFEMNDNENVPSNGIIVEESSIYYVDPTATATTEPMFEDVVSVASGDNVTVSGNDNETGTTTTATTTTKRTRKKSTTGTTTE